ncbi:MAG: T9SS type A sorting domain-containing protein [Bacteroidota bacterium]
MLLTVGAVVGLSLQSDARPNVNSNPHNPHGDLLRTAASCQPATQAIDLDINNVRARLMTGGDMWWNIGTSLAAYEVPKGGGASSLFAGSCWIGGYDAQGQLKVAAQTYRQDGNDYWPGPLDGTASIDQATCSQWDKFWKVDRVTINAFRELQRTGGNTSGSDYQVINEWPATGNQLAVGSDNNPLAILTANNATTATIQYAPFVDVNNNGIYDPAGGDYPDINGDQFVWWVFNDKGNVKGQTQTPGIGIEVQASAFAYATKDALNDATFYNFHLTNRGAITLDSTYISTWSDADLGYYLDDYIGCDTSRSLGILYNGKSYDGPVGYQGAYGPNVPMVGVDFFKGPIRKTTDATGKPIYQQLGMTVFDYFNNDGTVIGNPTNGQQIYNYMTGSLRFGQRFSNDFQGPGITSTGYGSGSISSFVFFGDPDKVNTWSECSCQNPPGDRRFIHSSGPFVLEPGAANDVTIGAPWVADVGGCPNTSFTKLRAADDLAQDLFNNNFKTIEGPEAPRMVIREMDKKLVFYLLNDSLSNNFQERYGYDLTDARFRVAVGKAKAIHSPDSLYKFEGYRVFQLKDATVQPSQIYNSKGEVDNTVAIEVFSCDMKNGVTKIVNYNKNVDVSDTTFDAQIKVIGKDSGIVHSFSLNSDQFTSSSDKRFVNYHSYYFVAIAYAYNDFAPFNPKQLDATQDLPYIESAHGGGGISIPVVVAIPNPSNGDMGTVLNADFGSGVVIKRLEGIGNGGNVLQLTEQSETAAMSAANGYVDHYPTYQIGQGPVTIKVIDPLKVQAADWELYITGPSATGSNATKGITAAQGSWKLVNLSNNDVIYSETNLNILNEQIIEKYGLSVSMNQVLRPGDDKVNGNGYISSDVTFTDPSKPWLAGINDVSGQDVRNWLRSGPNSAQSAAPNGCDYKDKSLDSFLFYENMFSNYSTTKSTWGPYVLANTNSASKCGNGVANAAFSAGSLSILQSVDLVFTSDTSKWTKCVVLEMHDDLLTSQGKVTKFSLRAHSSWNREVNSDGTPKYTATDSGMSWFPGYAINQETGERLNIMFGEDSWLKADHGADMIWNPSSNDIDNFSGLPIFGGKHYIYIVNSSNPTNPGIAKYDGCNYIDSIMKSGNTSKISSIFQSIMWVGVPTIAQGFSLLPLKDGLIPTDTRLRFRITWPYGVKKQDDPTFVSKNGGYPLYSFSTKDLAPSLLSDSANPYNKNREALLKQIKITPNPYYGYTDFETSNLDTRVRILNLPTKATIDVYSLDGTLIRTIAKDNANASYVDWDLRNVKGLPIASGMYLIHVNADGIGETVLKWFGSFRPLNISVY